MKFIENDGMGLGVFVPNGLVRVVIVVMVIVIVMVGTSQVGICKMLLIFFIFYSF